MDGAISVRLKYFCSECADKRTCRKDGNCPYADDIQEFVELNESFEPTTPRATGKKGTRVKNVETGEVFSSMCAAEKAMGFGYGTICKAVNKNRTAKGYHWVTV